MVELCVDARNTDCPVPILRAAAAFQGIGEGQSIELVTTDDLAAVDVPAWVDDMGYVIKETFEDGGTTHFVIVKH